MAAHHARSDEFFSLVEREKLWSSVKNLRHYLDYLYCDVTLTGKQVVDIGAGSGLFGIFAACSGAGRVVCLEPESAGASSGVERQFRHVTAQLDLDNIEFQPVPIQDYDAHNDRFDIILLNNSINHLDESACISLRHSHESWSIYQGLFRRLADMAAPGARLIITDCSSRNFFALLGVKNPFAPTIEWHKHQPPGVWVELGSEVGFGCPSVQWSSFNRLGSVGRALFGNRVAGYFLFAHFRLTMNKL